MNMAEKVRLWAVVSLSKVLRVPIRVREEFLCPWLAAASNVGSASHPHLLSAGASISPDMICEPIGAGREGAHSRPL